MPRVYSENFLYGRTGASQQYVTVPAGHRAVVKFIALNVYEAGLDYLSVEVGGTTVIYVYDLTPYVPRHWDVRAVAYAGQLIKINFAGADLSWLVSGFLFNDP